MKRIRKISLLLLALVLAAVFCAAVGAEAAENTAAPTAGSNSTAKQIVIVPYDEEGKIVSNNSIVSCMGGTTLYIKHKYRLVVCYYEQASNKIVETSDKLLLDVASDAGAPLAWNGNEIRLDAADEAYTFNVRVADPRAEGGEVNYAISVTRFNFSVIELLIAAVGVYLIVNAVRGKGSTFGDEFIKDEKKPLFRRLALILGILSGLVLIASAVLTICFSYIDGVNVIRYVLLGSALALLIAMAIINSVFTDREKRDKADKRRMGGAANTSAAFEFDGTEPTLDEVLDGIEQEKKEQ